MRIIAGRFKGRRLKSPPGDRARPMLDQTREAVFNILGNQLVDKHVVDCFAGSGAIGLEALSRGASFVTFFEGDKAIAKTMQCNIELCGAREFTRVIVGRLPHSLKRMEMDFDVVFLDPPFNNPVGIETLETIARLKYFVDGGLLIFRSQKEQKIEDINLIYLQFLDQRIYGRSKLFFFLKRQSCET